MLNVGFMNFYMSALRNMFLTSSIAVAIAGFSDRFNNTINKRIVKMIAGFILILSIMIGLKSTYDYKEMIKIVSQNDDLTIQEKLLIVESEKWPLIAYFYIAFIGVLFILLLHKNISLMN